MVEAIGTYMTSAKAIADDLMQYAPDKSAELAANLADMDVEKYEEVMRIAQDNGMHFEVLK